MVIVPYYVQRDVWLRERESERDTLLRLVLSFWVESQLRREREVTVGMEW